MSVNFKGLESLFLGKHFCVISLYDGISVFCLAFCSFNLVFEQQFVFIMHSQVHFLKYMYM